MSKDLNQLIEIMGVTFAKDEEIPNEPADEVIEYGSRTETESE